MVIDEDDEDVPVHDEDRGEPSQLFSTTRPSFFGFFIQKSFHRLEAMCTSLVEGQATMDERQSLMVTQL